MNQEVAVSAQPNSKSTPSTPATDEADGRLKGGVPSYKIKDHLAVWIEDDKAYVCDQDDEEAVKSVPLTELAAVFKRPGMQIIFYDAEPTLKLLRSKNVPVPDAFHCAHTQVILGLGHEYKFHKIDSLYDAVYGEGKPTTGEARSFALWWLHGEYLVDPNVHGSYLLKINEIKKKTAPKQ